MVGDRQPPDEPPTSGRAAPFWPRFVTWPPALQVVVWILGWPFVLASRARHVPGTSTATRVATTVLAVVAGVPWLLTLAALAALLVPGEGTGAGMLDDAPDVIFAPLDPETAPPGAATPEATDDVPDDGASTGTASDDASSAGPGAGAGDGSDAAAGVGPDAGAGGVAMTVQRIVDGDTLVLSGLDERARLIGIDAPELAHDGRPAECLGPEASLHLGDLVPPDTDVVVTFDVERTDRFGRPLVYLHRAVDGLFVNEAMLTGGYATTLTIEPNVASARALADAEGRARAAGRGLWSGACPAS